MRGKGILLALLAAILSGTAVFINSFGVKSLDPFIYTTLKNAAVALALACIFVAYSQRAELSKVSRRDVVLLLSIALTGGAAAFLLFFQGLALSTGATSSFIYRCLFVFASAIGIAFFRERLSLPVAAGGLLAIAGSLMLLSTPFTFGTGEALVLAATLLWSMEYALSKKALERLSPSLVALARMGAGSAFLFAFLAFTGRASQAFSLSLVQLEWVLISSAFLFFFVSFWYRSLKLVSLTQATAALTLGGPVTALLSLVFAGKALAPSEALGMFLLAAGLTLTIGYANLLDAFIFAKSFFKARAFPWKAE